MKNTKREIERIRKEKISSIEHKKYHFETFMILSRFIIKLENKYGLTIEEIKKIGIIEYFSDFYYDLKIKTEIYDLIDRYKITEKQLIMYIEESRSKNKILEDVIEFHKSSLNLV